MKKILLILLLIIPFIGFGQTAEEYFNKAFDYGKSGEYQLAIDNFTKCLRIDPDDADAYYNRGYSYDELGNYEDAIADYTRAIRIDPDYIKAYNNRGNLYDDLGKHEDLNILVKNGRYGIYVTNGKVNVTLPKDIDYNNLDIKTASEMIKNKKKKKFFKRK